MTIKECIDIVDNLKPNQYTIKDKVSWLTFIEEIIINDVIKTHEGYDGRYDGFTGYTEGKLSVVLIVPSPYDRLYTEYLKMMIDKENGETTRYNNSAASFNTYMSEYRKHYNKTHMPLSPIKRMQSMPPKTTNVGLSEAEYENIKRDIINALTEQLNIMVAPNVLYDIVNHYVQNNIDMLKGRDGRDGYTPIKGVDYLTEDDIESFEIDKKIENVLSNMSNTLAMPVRAYVNIMGGNNNWVEEDVVDSKGNVIGSRYGQTVNVNNATITRNSKVDLQITSEQMFVFHEKDLAFVAENDNGVITIYCIGSVPQNDYTIQAVVTEVVL